MVVGYEMRVESWLCRFLIGSSALWTQWRINCINVSPHLLITSRAMQCERKEKRTVSTSGETRERTRNGYRLGGQAWPRRHIDMDRGKCPTSDSRKAAILRRQSGVKPRAARDVNQQTRSPLTFTRCLWVRSHLTD